MKVLYALIAIIAALAVAAFFVPTEFNLQAEVVINAPKEKVWDYVKMIKNQENYSVWVMADTGAVMTYSGTDGTVGFVSTWSSEMKNVGVGEQEIVSVDEWNSYKVEIRFQKPMVATNYGTTTVEKITDTETKVTNVFEGNNPILLNLFSYFFLGTVQNDMQMNMENLKGVLESN